MKHVAQQKRSNRYAWAVVGMLWFVCFVNYADRQAISAIFPILEQKFGFSKFQLGLIGSIFMWLYAGGAFFAGFLSDKVSRKPLIIGGCLFWSLVTVCTGWCSKFWQFLTVRALEGIGEAFYFPSSSSLITDYHTQQNRSKAIALHQSGVFAGSIAGSWLGAWLAVHYGWYAGFYFFGGIGILLSIVLLFILKEPQRNLVEKGPQFLEKEKDRAFPLSGIPALNTSFEKQATLGVITTLRYLLQQRIVVLCILAFISANVVNAIFLTWMPTFLYEKFHLSLTMAGFYAVIFIQTAGVVSAPCSGWLADLLSIKIHNGRIVFQIACLLLGCFAIIGIGKATTLLPLIIAMIAFGVFKGSYEVMVYSAMFDYIKPQVRGSVVGLNITCGYLGGALGPLIVGAITTYGGSSSSAMSRMSTTIAASAGTYIIAALLLMGAIFVSNTQVK